MPAEQNAANHTGRFAPSPTGDLHLGNLRTALVAWLFARSVDARFVVRMEDLDRHTASREHEVAQLRDLAAIGLDWDGPVLRQCDRFARYTAAIEQLAARDLVYRCYCTRREIREAASAPHDDLPDGAYPGTCRELTTAQLARFTAQGRRPALRLRADDAEVSFVDRIHGAFTGRVDDVVLCRNDGVPAYNLVVVIDDAAQHVGEVVRGDDLLASTPRQLHLGALLGLRAPAFAHVPLVLAPDGARLAKRHGAVTLTQLLTTGRDIDNVRSMLGASLALCAHDEPVTTVELLARFDPSRVPRAPWTFGG